MDALKNIMKELKLSGSGSMSNKLRVEKILKHLEYSQEMIDQILSKFPVKKKGSPDAPECESGGEELDTDERRGEAELLNHLINQMTEQSEKPEKPEKNTPKSEVPLEEKTGGPAWEPCGHLAKQDVVVPPGCRLNVRMPSHASPNVQGTLPEGEKYKGFNSHSRSFCVDGSASSSSTPSGSKPRAALSQEAATAIVVAWLWSWFEARPDRSNKRQKV